MKPIFFGVGITAALGGLAVLLVGPRLDFLSPWWGTILRTYGLTLGLHAAAAFVTSIVVFYALARLAGLADLGRRVDLVERGGTRKTPSGWPWSVSTAVCSHAPNTWLISKRTPRAPGASFRVSWT